MSSYFDKVDLGFETIGNATIIVYDHQPLLATDPWITEHAYFGSWGHSHEIPQEQLQAIRECKFLWFSHGHPDHLNGDSLPIFHGKKILLPDHVGSRIQQDLLKQGFDVEVLPNKKWMSLSPHVRILCLADYNQDAILLIDINGKLIVNLNDAGSRGWEGFIQRTVRSYPISFLLALSGYGDADMIHFYDEQGMQIPPLAAKRFPVGAAIAKKVESYGCTYFIPSSSMHRYQRTDSAWANQFATTLDDYSNGFVSKKSQLLPAYQRYDCRIDAHCSIQPNSRNHVLYKPEEFGDHWSDLLEAADLQKAEHYFKSIEYLNTFLDFINLRVGGKDHEIALSKNKFDRGVTFEVPRGSLMTAMEYEVFDDLLIGNFMKTTLHGRWPKSGLYPDFSPYVAKYADNGRAKSLDELHAYFKEYQKRAPLNYLRHRLEEKSKDVFRTYISAESKAFQRAKRVYWDFKKMF